MYGEAAQRYWSAGWRGILPLPPRRKHSPPDGYTGHSGKWPSYPDVFAWTEENPDGNICIRLPEDVVGLDVDNYGTKTGGSTLAEAEKLWGPLPPTVRSTSRDDIHSGIRLYRVPPGVTFKSGITFRDKQLGGIDIIQYSHRYVVVSPSIHPDTGQPYRWLDDSGWVTDEIPCPTTLPELPENWVTELTVGDRVDLESVDVGEAIGGLTTGVPDGAVARRLTQAVVALKDSGSRHDNTLANVLGLLRLSEMGHPGVSGALRVLGDAFVSAVGSERPDAASEFERMVVGERGHALIASTPTPEIEVSAGDDDEFWEARHSLSMIRRYAYARLASPWAVLGVVLCRAVSGVPPHVQLPALVGGRASLNLFVGVVGEPGAGKGAAVAAGRDLFTGNDVHSVEVGSGEGLAHQYKHVEKGTWITDRVSVLFTCTEIGTLIAERSRNGSKLIPTLNHAYSGEGLGLAYADNTRRVPLGDHDYRMCLVMGMQPRVCGPILADEVGGLPQRILWLPAWDSGIATAEEDWDSVLIGLPCLEGREWAGSVPDNEIRLPREVVVGVRQFHKENRSTSTSNGLDGHSLLTKIKVATALAILDLRKVVTLEDWALADRVMMKSHETRSYVQSTLSEHNKIARTKFAEGEAFSEDIKNESMDRRQRERVTESLVSKAASRELTRKELLGKVSGRDRSIARGILDELVSAGLIEKGADGVLRLAG